jgi:ketosteroid isomerase-like protein
MDHAAAREWLARYVAAWESYDPDAIADLFSEDVAYRYYPYDEPVDASTRDAPGTYAAAYSPVAVDGHVVVATGTSSYRDRPDGPVVRAYDNCFVMRFDGAGRCTEFTEYYTKRP